MVDYFSEFTEDTSSIDQRLKESTELKHKIGFNCWCFDDHDRLLNDASMSICIHGRVVGHVWDDGSIYCWMCLVDEAEQGVALHDRFPTMHSDLEFSKHMLAVHLRNGWPEKYTEQLPEDAQYGDDWHIPKRKWKEYRERHLARADRISHEIRADGERKNNGG